MNEEKRKETASKELNRQKKTADGRSLSIVNEQYRSKRRSNKKTEQEKKHKSVHIFRFFFS